MCRYTCYVCGALQMATGGGPYSRCSACREANAYGNRPPDTWLGKDRASALIQAAIKSGQLLHPRQLKCADCDGQATEYEHRNYNFPLVVEPICRKCNLVRGPAIPIEGAVERLLAAGHIPYSLGASVAKLCRTMGAPHLAAGLPKKMGVADWRRLWPELVAAYGAPKSPALAG